MSLNNRPLLVGLLALFAGLQALLAPGLLAGGFDWKPLWGEPIVRAAMLDFTFTVGWCGLYLLGAARRERRNGWAWIPLLLILPTAALFLFTLTGRREGGPAA